MVLFATSLYITFVVWMTLVPSTVTVNGRPYGNLLGRAALAALLWPFLGFVFWMIGIIGRFMILPFISLFT